MTRKNREARRTQLHGNDRAGGGLYIDARHLKLHRLDEAGRLPGGPDVVWRRIPEIVQLFAAPLVGLAYVMFLPFVGFVLLFGVLFDALGRRLRPVAAALIRVGRPAWQPALAFLGRRRRRRNAEEKAPSGDGWSEKVRDEIEDRDEK